MLSEQSTNSVTHSLLCEKVEYVSVSATSQDVRDQQRAVFMNCSECRNLYRVFEQRYACYTEACSSAFYRVSSEIAARKLIDMERTKNDLHEHQLACPWAVLAEHVARDKSRHI